jgi:hypothetical protein
MADDRLTSYADIPALEAEHTKIIKLVDDTIAHIQSKQKELGNVQISLLDANSAKESTEAIGKGKKSIDELSISIKQLEKLQKDLVTTEAKLAVAETETAKALVAKKIELQAANKATKDSINGVEPLSKAYQELQKQAKNAAEAFKELAVTKGLDNKETIEAQKRAADLNNQLKETDYAIGNYQRNVGNYGGTFIKAFEVINKELTDTRAKLEGLKAGDEGFDELTKKAQALEKTTTGLDKTFNSTKQELKEFQEAAKQLGLTLGDDSEAFTKFASEVGQAKDEISDLQARVDFSASDTKYLDGTIEGLGALAGVYGIAEGASSLLGLSQEDLQKQMVNLQAIMAITNGLTEVQLVLQSDSKAMQTILALQTKIYSAAKSVENAINNASTVSTEANTLAKVQNRIATIANTVATTTQTAALSVYTFVTNGATIATKAFRAILVSTGIGAVVFLISTLVEAMMTYSDATKKATKDTKDYAGQLEFLSGITELFNKSLERNTKVSLAAAKARGASVKELQDIEDDALERKLFNLKQEKEAVDVLYNDMNTIGDNYIKTRDQRNRLAAEIADVEAEIEITKFDRITEASDKANAAAKKAAEERKKAAEEAKKNKEALDVEIAKIKLSFTNPDPEEIAAAIDEIQQIVDAQEGKIFIDAVVGVDTEKINKQISDIESETNNQLLGIEDAFNQGLMKTKDYEEAKVKAVADGNSKKLKAEIDGYKKILDFIPEGYQEKKTIQDKINELELADLEAQNAAKIDIEKKSGEDLLSLEQKRQNLISQLKLEAINLLETAISASFQKRIEELEIEGEKIEANTERQIKAIEESTLAEEEKVRRINEAEAVAAAEKEKNELKIAALKTRAARLDKMIEIAKIGGQTISDIAALKGQLAKATAAAATLGPASLANPLLVPAAAGMTASVGIIGGIIGVTAGLGLAQIAAVAARPIPKYAEGTGGHKGGLAILGDGKEHELVIEPNKKPYWSANTDTLYNLPKHTQVIPESKLGSAVTQPSNKDVVNAVMEMSGLIDGGLNKLNRTIRNKETVRLEAKNRRWQDYYYENAKA